MKGRFGGQLLFVTAKDENDVIFLVAIAMVEQENNDSWIWFLEQFANDIDKPEELNLVFTVTSRRYYRLAHVYDFITCLLECLLA